MESNFLTYKNTTTQNNNKREDDGLYNKIYIQLIFVLYTHHLILYYDLPLLKSYIFFINSLL